MSELNKVPFRIIATAWLLVFSISLFSAGLLNLLGLSIGLSSMVFLLVGSGLIFCGVDNVFLFFVIAYITIRSSFEN